MSLHIINWKDNFTLFCCFLHLEFIYPLESIKWRYSCWEYLTCATRFCTWSQSSLPAICGTRVTYKWIVLYGKLFLVINKTRIKIKEHKHTQKSMVKEKCLAESILINSTEKRVDLKRSVRYQLKMVNKIETLFLLIWSSWSTCFSKREIGISKF